MENILLLNLNLKEMKKTKILLIIICSIIANHATAHFINWDSTKIYTANNEDYLSADEKEMIAEINRVRTNPRAYIQYIKPLLVEAQKKLRKEGRGSRSYGIMTSYRNGRATKKRIYFYENEEEVKAIKTLIEDLENIGELNALKPSKGIHRALKKHARDQKPKGDIDHLGTDGTWPNDRITKYAKNMAYGNENIAGITRSTPRSVVLLLLIDSGIKGYGHRYNILNPEWTHCSCLAVGQITEEEWAMDYWIQNFGKVKEQY
jgi:uncharacterized protein YkwD